MRWMQMMRSAALLGMGGVPALLFSQTATPAPAPVKQPLSVLVFSDFECPFSAHLFFALQQYEHAHPGALHVTYKQSPLSIHPGSPLAHRAALAAARQGQFNAMAELLYANQKRQDRPQLLAYARQLHLDLPRFQRDLNSAAVQSELAADMEESRAFAVHETPTTYIEGKTLVGDQTAESLAAAIDGAAAAQVDASAPPVAAPAAPAIDPALTAAMQRAPSAELGNAGAPLTIVEFTDFECPFCKAAVQPMEQFMAAHGREVRWVVRSFPLDFHPDSELANEAALAAGEQGKFWPMHDLLFAHQDGLKLVNLREYAAQLHLDMHAFDDALATHRLAGQIAADRALGIKAGVDGTPTFFIDGQSLSGVQSVTELEQLLAEHKLPASDRPAVVLASAQPAVERRVLGAESGAALTVTWYTDVRSPLAAAQAQLVRSLAQRYDGKVRVLFKAYPLESHPDGRLASTALVAAFEQGKFWQMYDALAAHAVQLDRSTVLAMATGLKLDPAAFVAALDAAPQVVQQDVDEAQRRGILGAPVIFLNDKRVDGLQREAFYTAIADEELQQTPAVQAQLASPLQPAQ